MKRRTHPRNEDRIPARPFQRWLNERFEFYANQPLGYQREAVASLCAEIGWHGHSGARRLYRYRNGLSESTRKDGDRRLRWSVPTHTFPRWAVEDALHCAGVDFYSLYPEFSHERDIRLEDDAWCPSCQDLVTPIDGVCPWCEWRVSQVAA